MSKKVSLMLSIVVALFGIIFVSVYGKLPENLYPKIYMKELYFQDQYVDEVSKNGNKIIYFDVSQDNLSINLYNMVAYAPLDTTDITISFSVDKPEMATITRTGMLTIGEAQWRKFVVIEVTIKSMDGSELSDKVMIVNQNQKDNNHEIYDGDDWII